MFLRRVSAPELCKMASCARSLWMCQVREGERVRTNVEKGGGQVMEQATRQRLHARLEDSGDVNVILQDFESASAARMNE